MNKERESKKVIELMKITADNKLKKLIVVGDRVLIKPVRQSEKTASGLYLPPGVQEKEKIQSGYVIKVGPGYPLPLPADEDEMWKGKEDQVKYLPLQAQEAKHRPTQFWLIISIIRKRELSVLSWFLTLFMLIPCLP